jgi:hypothetical protein
VVTHPTTNPAIYVFCMRERTGPPVFRILWSHVKAKNLPNIISYKTRFPTTTPTRWSPATRLEYKFFLNNCSGSFAQPDSSDSFKHPKYAQNLPAIRPGNLDTATFALVYSSHPTNMPALYILSIYLDPICQSRNHYAILHACIPPFHHVISAALSSHCAP